MADASVLLELQIGHVLLEAGRFGVVLGIAAAGQTEAAEVFLDVGGHVAGVKEVVILGQIWVAVAAQAHDVADAQGEQVLQICLEFLPGVAQAGDMGQGLNLQLVFQKRGHVCGGDTLGAAAAGAAGDADKGGIHGLELAQRVLELRPAGFCLGRKDFDGEDTALFCEILANQHITDTLYGVSLRPFLNLN